MHLNLGARIHNLKGQEMVLEKQKSPCRTIQPNCDFLVKGEINQINKARCKKKFIAVLLINRKKTPKSYNVIMALCSF